jgi:hypothetical protein
MPDQDIELREQPKALAKLGQATHVEQARAVAEVQASIVVAQQCPRDVAEAISQMRDACRRKSMAERAFFSLPRAGQSVTGVTIHLATELARCWGNIQYDVAELRRDDEAGESEMKAWAWDVQTNARASVTWIVPHARDTTKYGRQSITKLNEVYENNANQASRRLREVILKVLPTWFTEDAKEACWETLKTGDTKPLDLRIADAIAHFEKVHGVTRSQLERKLGRSSSQWTDLDVVQLQITSKSITRGEVTRDEAFPEEVINVAEVIGEGVRNSIRIPQSSLRVYNADGTPKDAEPIQETPGDKDASADSGPVAEVDVSGGNRRGTGAKR